MGFETPLIILFVVVVAYLLVREFAPAPFARIATLVLGIAGLAACFGILLAALRALGLHG